MWNVLSQKILILRWRSRLTSRSSLNPFLRGGIGRESFAALEMPENEVDDLRKAIGHRRRCGSSPDKMCAGRASLGAGPENREVDACSDL